MYYTDIQFKFSDDEIITLSNVPFLDLNEKNFYNNCKEVINNIISKQYDNNKLNELETKLLKNNPSNDCLKDKKIINQYKNANNNIDESADVITALVFSILFGVKNNECIYKNENNNIFNTDDIVEKTENRIRYSYVKKNSRFMNGLNSLIEFIKSEYNVSFTMTEVVAEEDGSKSRTYDNAIEFLTEGKTKFGTSDHFLFLTTKQLISQLYDLIFYGECHIIAMSDFGFAKQLTINMHINRKYEFTTVDGKTVKINIIKLLTNYILIRLQHCKKEKEYETINLENISDILGKNIRVYTDVTDYKSITVFYDGLIKKYFEEFETKAKEEIKKYKDENNGSNPELKDLSESTLLKDWVLSKRYRGPFCSGIINSALKYSNSYGNILKVEESIFSDCEIENDNPSYTYVQEETNNKVVNITNVEQFDSQLKKFEAKTNAYGEGIAIKLCLNIFYRRVDDKNIKYDNKRTAYIDGQKYNAANQSERKDFIEKILGFLEEAFDKIFESLINKSELNKELIELVETQSRYDEFVKSLKKNSAKEKDFFFINNQAPSNPFIDIQFRIPEITQNKNGENSAKETWISIAGYGSTDPIYTSVRNLDGTSKITNLYPGTYFSSMSLQDEGGARKIDIELKSPRDMNLEEIIMASLGFDQRDILIKSEKEDEEIKYASSINDSDMLMTIIRNYSANFRVKFGYRDGNENCINVDSSSDQDFLNRTYSKKPVTCYPWTYFKITDLQTSIIGNEYVYKLSGIDSCSCILNNTKIGGINDYSFSVCADNPATPFNVLGTISKWIYKASNKRICVLGSQKGKVVTGVGKNSNGTFCINEGASYKLQNEGSLLPSDLDIEDSFFTSTACTISQIEFNPIDSSEDDVVSIGVLLDKLVNWLPRRLYFVCKKGDDTVAARISYKDAEKLGKKWYEEEPHVSETIRYQIIEADASVDDDEVKKTYFIRFFYEGPGFTYNPETGGKDSSKNSQVLRIYSHDLTETQVVKNVNINNGGMTFSNLAVALNVVSGGEPLTFFANTSGTMTSEGKVKSNGMSIDQYLKEKSGINDDNEYYYLVPCQKISNSYISGGSNDDNEIMLSSARSLASAYFTALSHQNYQGEITIMGDPFYYFDSYLQPCNYLIYLNENRTRSLYNSEMCDSYFTGTYQVKKITHTIQGNAEQLDYDTVLEVIKYSI